jgi:hypothetical protein
MSLFFCYDSSFKNFEMQTIHASSVVLKNFDIFLSKNNTFNLYVKN